MSKPTVAIIGTSGFLGKPTLDAFESPLFEDKFQFPIKALSRSSKPSTDKIKYIQGNLDDDGISKVVEEFKGIDVIIELSGPQVFGPVESIVKQVKPKLFIPSQFGTEIDKSDKIFPGLLSIKTEHSNVIRDAGIKVVDVISSLFAAPGAFLYEIVGQVGIEPESKSVTYRGDPDLEFSFTHVNDIGRSVVAIAATEPSKLPNKIRIQSGLITPRQVVEKYEKNHNVKLAVKNESSQEALKEGQARYAKGFNLEDFLYYLSVLVSQGVDNGLLFSQNENELVNPGNKLWTWEKY